MNKKPIHPGVFIKKEIFPPRMTVTAAAELLNIGRSALSRVLNGKASLSSGLAERIHLAFGFPSEELLKMQASYDAEISENCDVSNPVGSYVPPFLQIQARQIEDWASEHRVRTRLSVLLRTLVNSTGSSLRKVDFPGNDDAERRGWDGVVEADRATPWIPQGFSGWEFGCNQDIKRKADEDFRKRTQSVPEAERLSTTFVFVTPRRWTGKNDWEKERREESQWKDVRVFDASDLEQWMEQSIPAQTWFVEETGLTSKEVSSLEGCWKNWEADCEPVLIPSLFNQALKESKDCVMRWLAAGPGTPLKIAADSMAEALAYLYVVFSGEEALFKENRNKVIVFNKSRVVSKLLSTGSDLIVVSTSPEIETELASLRKSLKTILVYSQNMANVNPDIVLKPLNYSALVSALEEMGCNHDEVNRYCRECGYSLTVLRRRLSKLPGVKTPGWASTEHAESLVPMVFAGAWNANNDTDRFLVSELADEMDPGDIEKEIRKLCQLEDSPVWSVDTYRGVKSKIDALFAVSESVTESDIERFLQVAEIVLSEKNPELDFPEDEQWLAELRGKSRGISDLLRGSVINSFVLLAVHGNGLFRERIGFDIEARIQEMVKKLLNPLTARTLEDQVDALSAYAEAAPDTFLSIIEQDLDKNKGDEVLELFRPMSTSSFKSPPRAEMLWALESLAWSGEYLARVVKILARLAEAEISDNWANKPISSLAAIFRSWLPQTSAPVDKRIEVFNQLIEECREDIGWFLFFEQFGPEQRTGHYSHKPKWRTDGHGYGEPVTENEKKQFIWNAARKALDWKSHTKETLADLVHSLGPPTEIPYEWLPEVWKLIENWHNEQNTSDEDRAWFCERMRTSVDFRVFPEARKTYEKLEPSDPVIKHRWLFRCFSVPRVKEGFDDLNSRDFLQYAGKIKQRRISALSEIYSEQGINGLIKLASNGEGQIVIGDLAMRTDSFGDDEVKDLILKTLANTTEENSHQMEKLIMGTLGGLEDMRRKNLLEDFSKTSSEEMFLKILLLAPFSGETWKFVNRLGKENKFWYWKEVALRLTRDSSEVNEAVERLIEAGRSLDAAVLAEHNLEDIEPRRIFRLLEAIVKTAKRKQKDYQLNLDKCFVEDAFKQLDKNWGISSAKMLNLEIDFVNFLEGSERGMRILEKEVNDHPEFFAEMITLACKRDDGTEDKNLYSTPEDVVKSRAWKMQRSIESIRQLPGRDNKSGEIKTKNLITWVSDVRAVCERHGRRGIGDFRIGFLISNSPEGKDGIWPCESVRDALEKVYSEQVAMGFKAGRCNSSRTHIGHGGDPERAIKDRHEKWAQRIQYSHPKTSKILGKIAQYYSQLGRHYDIEAEIWYRQLSY